MVYKYKRRTERASWIEETLQAAMEAVTEDEKMSIRGAAEKFNIPYPTLRKHIIKKSAKKSLGRFRRTFSDTQEEQFVEYLHKMESCFYGLTKNDLKSMAYQLAERNHLQHSFKNEKAGDQWVADFMNRHPSLSLRTPETTSIARSQGFNRVSVSRFFTLLRDLLDKHHFAVDDIYNVDETAVKTSATKPPKIIARTGKKQVGVISSLEKGALITSLVCCSATGQFIPPALIFPRKRLNPALLDRAPPGTLGLVSDSGWVNSTLFLQWLQFFVQKVRPTNEHKILLILDNHESHKSIDVLDYAKAHGVVILSVPPHTTHKLQPLDVSVFGPLKIFFEQTVDTWQKSHPGRHITQYDIGELFAKAYFRSASVENAVNGFLKTGIRNCDMNVFSDVDFAAAEVSEREELAVSHHEQPSPSNQDSVEQTLPTNIAEQETANRPNSASPLTTCSAENIIPLQEAQHSSSISSIQVATEQPATQQCDEQEYLTLEVEGVEYQIPVTPSTTPNCLPVSSAGATPNNAVSPEDIRPYPKKQRAVIERRSRKKQQAEVLTSTPYKQALLDRKTKARPRNQSNIGPSAKRKLTLKSQDLPKSQKKIRNSKNKRANGGEEDTTPCSTCKQRFCDDTSGMNWIRCQKCHAWFHNACQGLPQKGQCSFICIECDDSV